MCGWQVVGNPRNANGHRRRQVRARVLAEESLCGICGLPVDKTIKTPHPDSPEVDEIIPVSLGGSPTKRSNCRLTHRICNAKRGNGTSASGRHVVLICGPPGAGKTTAARALGLPVYDVDDPQWGSETQFRSALRALAGKAGARAVVIRSAATLSARAKAADMCGATAVTVIDTDLATCIARITKRGRLDPPIRTQVAAAHDWWGRYEPGEIVATQSEPAQIKRVRAW